MSLNVLRWPRALPARPTGRLEQVVSRPRVSEKWLAGAFSIGLLVVLASPIVENWKSSPRDDFPLSYYRMFSEQRGDTQRVTYLVGLDDHGGRFLLPYQYAGPGGMNQVRRQINKNVEQGDASRLCRTVAARVARVGKRLADLHTVEITTGTFRMSEYFRGQQAPRSESISARCSVARGKP
jgi:hypothetical protein